MALNTTDPDPKVIEFEKRALLKSHDQTVSDITGTILDSSWAKRAFLINDNELGNGTDIANRYWSSASAKFTDTRLGANVGINSKPQFTRYSDVRVKGRLTGRNPVNVGSTAGNYGMGRYYSDAIDDPSQTVYLRFGVPEFNSLTNFIAKAFDANMTSIARTGRAPSIFYTMAKAAGTAATVIAFPPIALTIVTGKVIGSFFTRPTSKFYNLKPTMHNYWSTVNLLVNTIAINKGILPKILADEEEQRIGKPFKLDTEYLKQLSDLMPGTFNGGNYFDMYRIANKAQRLANQLFADDFENLNNGTATDYTGYVKKDITGDGSHPTYISDDNGGPTLAARLSQIATFGHYKTEGTSVGATDKDPRIGADGQEIKDPEFFEEFKKDLDSEFRDGSQFAVFKVDHTGSISESFGNSIGESDLSQKLNSASSSARQAKFSFANGNIMEVPGIVSDIVGAVGDVAVGALSGVTLGFSDLFTQLAGAGYIDIPKYWQSSSATLPRTTYTMKLISPYNNPISQMQNIHIPLCMLLAGTLPLSTGKQSYTSPFICQLFDRGRVQVRLGIIESLSITRGTSNLPFDTQGKALALDVSFTIVDMSSIVHMPVSTGSIFGVDMTLDEDNILADYLAVLAGQDMYTQIYPMQKAKLNLAKKIMQSQKLTSPAYWSSLFHESSTSGALQYLTLGSFNAIEGIARGSSIASGNQ